MQANVQLAGDVYIALTPDSAATFERGSGRQVASMQRERGSLWLVDDDDLWLLRRGGDRWEITRHPTPALTPAARIELSPSSVENPSIVVGSSSGGQDEIVLELAEGTLSAHDARSGALLGSPIELAHTPDERRWYRERDALMWRADEPRQALVSTPNGRLQLWDVPAGMLIHDLPIPGAVYGNVAAAGDRLAASTTTDTIEIWDLASGQRIGEPMPAPGIGSLLGFDAEGRLASTHGSYQERIVLYDIERRVEVATMWPAGTGQVRLADDRAGYLARGQYGILPSRIAVTADRWREHLCGLLPAELSPAARDLLPPGVDASSPCPR
jgi:WD40 repeat protein